MCDLYQNPEQRPRKGSIVWPTLTTGCARMYMIPRRRFASGFELLLLHGLPVTMETAQVMQSFSIDITSLSHRMQCHLAGNSMHACCVGLVSFAFLVCGQRP